MKEGKLGENAKSGFASLSSKVTSGWSDFSNMWSDGPKSKALTDAEDSEQTGLASASNKKFVLSFFSIVIVCMCHSLCQCGFYYIGLRQSFSGL